LIRLLDQDGAVIDYPWMTTSPKTPVVPQAEGLTSSRSTRG
jgi:hypothetical protein